jgi:hypothetical protein
MTARGMKQMAFQVKTGSEANEIDYSAITLRRIVLELLGHYANLR